MLRGLLSFCFFLNSFYLIAQNGTIAGIITDAKSGETVVGANVVIHGTSVGAATDIDGKFNIPNVKPGTYNLTVTFITYKPHSIPDVSVEGGKVSTIQVQMQEDVSQLQEIVITGVREINTDVSLISAIKESKLVVSGISAEQISRSQDRDAAQVVRRVPGVTLQDNRFVVVRGLASRYSNVMLNGVLAPSTETDVRAFSFDIIPSSLVDRMLIYKSGSAELPGDFAGSVIQIDTKSAAEENFTNFSFGTGYRFNTTMTMQQSQQRSSTEWLGFDNGPRDMPEGAPSDYADLGFDVQKIEAESKKFSNTWGLEEINIKPDLRFNIDLGRNFNLGKVTLGSINSVSYSNTNQFNDIEFNRYQNYTEDGSGDFISEDFFRYRDKQFTNNVRLGLLSNWTLKYSDRSKIEFKNLYNRIGSAQTTIREGDNFFRQQHYKNYSMRYIERTIYSGQLQGTHELRRDKSKISWLAGYTSASRNEPDWKRLVSARPLGTTEETPFTVAIQSSPTASNAARFYQELDEYNLTNRLDFEYKFTPLHKATDPFELKAGYWLEYKGRSFEARQIAHVARDGFNEEIASLSYDKIFDKENVAFSGGHYISEGTKISDSYVASNLITAGYASLNMPLSQKIRVVVGIRTEHNIQQLETPEGPGAAKVDNPITSILPSLNVSYDLNALSLLRFAYSKTINRPEFRELAPFSFYDFENEANIIGNDSLDVANIHNVDLRWELYPTPGELVSLGVFYKNFRNPIETNIDNGTDSPVFLFNNADNAQSYGVEAEIRKSLAYTSSSRILNNTSVILNAAYIFSEINLKSNGSLQENASRPMQGQSPYIINAGLFYNDERAGLQANIQYNIFGKRIAFVGLPGQPSWWEMPRHMLDLTMSKRISKRTDLRFGISDVFNFRAYIREDANLDSDVENHVTNKIVRSTRNGQYVTLGVVVKL
jgi:outer membrane receptor for ferrienterochelin and colicin